MRIRRNHSHRASSGNPLGMYIVAESQVFPWNALVWIWVWSFDIKGDTHSGRRGMEAEWLANYHFSKYKKIVQVKVWN